MGHMDAMLNPWGWLVLGMLLLQLLLHGLLDWRHLRHVRRHSGAVPEAFANKVSLEEHRKAATYSIAKIRLSFVSNAYSALLLLLLTFGGGLQLLHDVLRLALSIDGMSLQLAFLGVLWAGLGILDLPLDWYRTFRLEQRFGFNRTTGKIFMGDLAKNVVLGALLGGAILLLTLFTANSGKWQHWLLLWLALVAFQVFLTWAWPTFIAPLFNKFRPLENQTLKLRIEELLKRNDFHSDGIYVMDGSARSAHGNAYFTGFGKSKRIVFFDTLIDSLDHEQIEAVLAHELGHFKCKHIRNRMIALAALSLVLMAALAWCLQSPWFYHGLGVQTMGAHTGLALFVLVLPVFMTFIQPVFSATSRRHEYEADDFAASQAPAAALQQALVKLYRDNANTLTPDPWYSRFHHSHPPPLARIDHLQKLGA